MDGLADYLADGGDIDDDDSSDNDEEEEASEEEEEKHLALSDSVVAPVVDYVPSFEETESFETYESAATPPLPSSLHLPPHVPTSLPLPSSPLPPLPVSLFIPPPVDHTEIRRHKAKEVGYGIRDVWVDPVEAVEEVAPTTLEEVNARVTELAAVQEQDTQDIYAVIEDGHDRQTQLSQRVDVLTEDRQFHYETARLLDQEALDYLIASQESLMTTLIAQVSSLQGQLSAALGQIQALQAKDQTHADDRDGAANTAVGLVFSFLNNMPPRRTSAAARTVAATPAATAPMTAITVEQLIEARVSAALANHETLRNSTNG
ncbi:hypothetical protein Tco_1422034 [Tanacetum coccineum]